MKARILMDATSASIELEAMGHEDITLQGDSELLGLLLANLGRNACIYNERDPVKLCLTAEPRGRELVLHFDDNGIGVPPAERDRIFGEFYRAPDPSGRGVRGSGLGLAMCRRIMRLHGGRIRLARSGPEGSAFELRFPMRESTS